MSQKTKSTPTAAKKKAKPAAGHKPAPKPKAPHLNPREQSAMSFASKAFKEPWFNLVAAQGALERGGDLSREALAIDTFFVPFKLDARLARFFMKAGGVKLFVRPNGTMLTLVLDETGKRLIWSCIEEETGGVYPRVEPLTPRLHEPWAKEVEALLAANRLDEAYEVARVWAAGDEAIGKPALGVIKVAHIQFFEAFQQAWDDSHEGQNLLALALGMQRTLQAIAENHWLRFYPATGIEWLLKTGKPVLDLLGPVNEGLLSLLGAKGGALPEPA